MHKEQAPLELKSALSNKLLGCQALCVNVQQIASWLCVEDCVWQPLSAGSCAEHSVGSKDNVVTWHWVQSLENASTSRLSSTASSACERRRVFLWPPFFQGGRRWVLCLVYTSYHSSKGVFLRIKCAAVSKPKITIPELLCLQYTCQFEVAA